MLKLNPTGGPSPEEPRPSGVAVIATIFLLAAAYLILVGALLLAHRLSLNFGAPILTGLEQAGPYMFLLVGVTAALTGWDLLRLDNWGRWAAIVAALFGLVMLVPSVSMSVIQLNPARLAAGGVGIMVRSAILWYLFQEPVRERFR
ncbi:MAG TPA: hypothetical protein VH088_09055 [Terriglobales bacterium]|jgi:hypothetical protein|nr:hypothetical protein [Terriglobales bacterium]